MTDPSGAPRRAFRLPTSRARIDESVDEEFAFHLQERIEELVLTGLSRPEAEAEARRRFGDVESYRRQAAAFDERAIGQRDRIELADTVRREVRQAARALLRSPVFTIVALVTLALGIGATTAVYAILDAVVLRPLPYAEPERLVSVLHPATVPGTGDSKWGMSSAGYFFFARENRTLSDLGVYVTGESTITGDGTAEVVRTGRLTHNLFTILGARPAAGRLLLPDDDVRGAPSVVVLGWDLWQGRYGGDRDVVGREIQLSFGPATVIGVTERGFNLPRPGAFASATDLAGFRVDLWMPLQLNPAARAVNSHPYSGIGRLAPGATAEDAQRDLAALTRRLPDEHPSAYSALFMNDYRFGMAVEPLRESLLGPTIPRMLWIILGAVALVFIIAFANVGNLFLVRAEARAREVAIRTALGAARTRLAAHALAESLLLTTIAGAAAVAIAAGGLGLLVRLAPRDVPRLAEAALSPSALMLAVALTLLSGITFGLIPILRGAAGSSRLREGARGSSASRGQRATRNALVITQVALALVLLTGAGLMVRSFAHLMDVRPGIDPAGVLTFDLVLPSDGYGDDARAAEFHRQFQERLGGLPGVTAVGATTHLPLRNFGTTCTLVFRPDEPFPPGLEPPCVATPQVTPGFFDALGMTVQGESSEWSDIMRRHGVAVVTGALAQRLWPGQEAIGKTINSNGSGPDVPIYRVIGVIPEFRGAGLDQPPTEAVFYPPMSSSDGRWWNPMRGATYAVRTAGGEPTQLMAAIRSAAREMDERVALANPMTMDAVMSRSMARVSFILLLMGLAAAIALLLSAVGLYGVVSYLVSQRRGEIGIRMALGARVPQVAAMVMMQSVRLAILGALIGLAGAFAGTRLMRALLFEVSPTDPVIFSAVAASVLLIAAIASIGPARRAARIPPADALRAE
jgi:predicted permease